MSCSLTIDDGTTIVVLDYSQRVFRVAFSPVAGGASILRFLDGSAQPQTRWQKQKLTVTGEDTAPSELLALDYTQAALAVTVERGEDTLNYTCTALGVQETWDYTAGKASWSLLLEEV